MCSRTVKSHTVSSKNEITNSKVSQFINYNHSNVYFSTGKDVKGDEKSNYDVSKIIKEIVAKEVAKATANLMLEVKLLKKRIGELEKNAANERLDINTARSNPLEHTRSLTTEIGKFL